ncbi:MAG: sulfite exporter TauE/SafE family protein [Gammaproteobacteria bacterium]|nr:sulfite exporter TauE/SafE family protein [Gammaproteobacteria bacterium]
MEFILYVFAGALVGFAIGLTGVGGGSLMTPLLLMFGFPAPVAIGTDLLYAALTKATGAISHHRKGNVNWKIVITLASGSIPVAVLLHLFLLKGDFQEGEQFEELLTLSLGVMLILTSIILISKDKLIDYSLKNKPFFIMGSVHRYKGITTFIVGALLGLCVTLSSVGAGAFGAAVLLIIYRHSPTVRIIGTDVAHAVPLTLVAGLGYLFNGYVDGLLLLCLLIGSLPAIHLGAHVSSNVPEKILQKILITILLLLGINYTFF